jgi:hypothetical protein
MINIVKLLNGNVAIYDNTSGDFLFSLSPAIIEMHCDTNSNLRVVQNNDNFEFFDPNLVANTQVLPAAAIPFSGSCADLADILATDFFFEMTETIDAIDVNYDNSTSGLISTNVQDAIDELSTFAGGGGILHGTASGTDTYTVSLTGVTSYADGDAYLIRFPNGNTTTATLNVNSLGAKTLYRNNDGAVIGGDIWAGAEMLCVYNSTINGFQCIGTTSNALFSYVTNADSVTLTKGMPVYAFGGTGDRMTVKRANNSTDATSAQTVGLVLSTSIGVNQKGIIMMQGLLDNLSILPTSTFSDGDTIYLGATAGSITNVKPYAPNHLVYLGVVTTASNGNAGRMYVRVQNGYELDELHNVAAQSPADKDGIFFNTATQLWEKKSIATVLGYTPASAARLINTTSPLSGGGDLTADRTLSISQANGSTNGFLSSSDWTIFNNKQNALGFTPVPQTRTLTINGSTQDLSANRTFTISNPEGWTVIVKSANQDVSTSTLTDDTELQFSVVAAGNYMLQVILATSASSSVNDYQYRFAVSAGTINGIGNAFHRNSTNVATQTVLSALTAANTNNVQIGQIGGTIPVNSGIITTTADFGFYASANATLKLQFSIISGTGSVARTWKGSILKYKRID